MKQISRFKLHSRITVLFLIFAVISTVSYLTVIVTVVERMEQTMLATLVGHEVDELITELALDSEAKMPYTASVKAYMKNRDHLDPIPDYLRNLSPNVYNEIAVEDKTYQVAIIDFQDDRLYVSFDTTGISDHRLMLFYLLTGGGLFSTIVLVLFGVWLFRKFLAPVSALAEEVSKIDPNDRKIRIEEKYHDYEVGLIAESIDQFLVRMDEFIEREQSFTAAASHELRTPLSVITTATDLLELKGVTDKQQSVVNRIKESTRYMGNVIDSLLFFARSTHDAVEKTLPVIDLHDIFSRTLKNHEQLASERKLELLFDGNFRTKVRMAENHIEIILSNLIRNAISNTNEGEVKVSLLENGFSVTDTGQGIQPVEIDLVVNLHYHSPDSSGFGLGLYLVKNICDVYGLKLEIDSEVGCGSKFVIIFPDSIIS